LHALRTAAVSPRLSYTLTAVRSASARGQLKNIPRHVVQAAGRARLPLKIESDFAVTWTSQRYLDDANTVSVGSSLDIACRVRRPFGRVDLRLDLLNLADTVTWGPGYVLAGLDGVLVPYALPAAPRGVRVGLSYQF
jgi:outer membrane receptor protein involved in Fe transport